MIDKEKNEGNIYDKIIKENIEAVFLPLSEKYLGIKITKTHNIPHDLQVTLERKADFLKIVETPEKERFILHIEFQTKDEKEMIFRMQEYFSILRRKYQLPVRQFVLYLGARPSRMRTQLKSSELFTGFVMTSFRNMDAEQLLVSDIPEEVILAVLGNFPKNQADRVIQIIFERLQVLKTDASSLKKYVQQLEILSKLRNLNELVLKRAEDMPITLDIKDDFVYKKGKQEGREEGKQEGREEGKQEGREEGKQEGREEGKRKEKETIKNTLKMGLGSVEQIAKIFNVSLEYVEQIQKELEK